VTASSKLFLDEAKHRYEQENSVANNIESGATNLVGWSGLIISVLLSGGGIIVSKEAKIHFSTFEAVLLSMVIVLLFVSLTLAIIAFRKGRYSLIPDPVFLLDNFQRISSQRLAKELTLEMILASIKNREISETRQNYISLSQAIFIAGMLSSTIFLIIEAYYLLLMK
jgi:hypothetical protein